jgi:NADH dehydrogenase
VRSRLTVAVNWLWIHLRDQRGARLITQGAQPERPSGPPPLK